jgi:hypothetical protein
MAGASRGGASPSRVVSTLVTVGVAVLMIPAEGARGAPAGSTIGYAAGAALAWMFFAALGRRGSSTAPATIPACASPARALGGCQWR